MSKLESLQPTWNGAKGELFADNALTITAQSADPETPHVT